MSVQLSFNVYARRRLVSLGIGCLPAANFAFNRTGMIISVGSTACKSSVMLLPIIISIGWTGRVLEVVRLGMTNVVSRHVESDFVTDFKIAELLAVNKYITLVISLQL